ncbi:MAG: Card1-like endonuclease domain-containing protein [Rivularia sp. (in: cyanobacteria)]
MSASEFDEYKVDHLFLLIGENPLPNYVAAKMLLKEGGTAYLVHTTGTNESATRLQKILKSELNGFKDVVLLSLGDYESDAFHIQKKIREELEKIKSGKIGLNYTGGTKAMAVHGYKAAFADRPDTIFSYLDPRRLEMCIDREDRERDRLKIKPETLQVQLVKLFQLHGLELKANPTQQPQLAKLATEFAKVFQEEAKAKQWFDWYCKIFCEQARKKKENGSWGNWKSKTDLSQLSINLGNLPQQIITAFEKEKFLDNENKALSLAETVKVFPKIEDFCKWLDGLWLEHYVLEEVQNIASSHFIGDYGLNFEIPLIGTKNGFEFDVAFTRGYQLFALSCTTTSDRKLCKSKLFEAYLRARQMGGDEARVALICCSNEPDTLKAEIADSINDKKIQVFGREHLTNLSQEIADWIAQNDREASK